MSSTGLLQDIKNNPIALIAAIVLHVVLIVVMSVNLSGTEVHVPKRQPQKTVEAVVVDASKVQQEIEKLRRIEADKKAALKREQDKLKKQKEELKRKKEAQRKEAERKKKLAAEKKRKAELKKKQDAEKKRKAELKKEQEAEKKRKAELERKKAAEEKRKREAEAKRQAELKKKQEEEARRKQAEEELRKKIAEEERREREAKEAAERAARLDRLRDQYIRDIEAKVSRSWLRPANVKSTQKCLLHVTQMRTGDVLDVKLRDCQGSVSYLSSIEKAVRRASPLPVAPDPDLFHREILFTFRPD